MEIDVTRIWRMGSRVSRYSDSIANSGRQDIGAITWANAVKAAKRNPLCTPEQQDELREWLRDFGAWDAAEIKAMSDAETNALLLQFVAGDCHELRVRPGGEQRRMYAGDSGRMYFYVGS